MNVEKYRFQRSFIGISLELRHSISELITAHTIIKTATFKSLANMIAISEVSDFIFEESVGSVWSLIGLDIWWEGR